MINLVFYMGNVFKFLFMNELLGSGAQLSKCGVERAVAVLSGSSRRRRGRRTSLINDTRRFDLAMFSHKKVVPNPKRGYWLALKFGKVQGEKCEQTI